MTAAKPLLFQEAGQVAPEVLEHSAIHLSEARVQALGYVKLHFES